MRERGEILPDLTRVMISVAQYLDGESYETPSDLVALEVNKQLDEHNATIREKLTDFFSSKLEVDQEIKRAVRKVLDAD